MPWPRLLRSNGAIASPSDAPGIPGCTPGLLPVSLTALLLIAFGICSAGCSQRHRYKHPVFATEQDAVAYLKRAMEDPLPDERRRAITEIARTRYVDHATVVEGLAAIAGSDPSPAVRATALFGLRESGRPEAGPTFLDSLSEARRPTLTSSPIGNIRLESLRGLTRLARNGDLPPDLQQAAAERAVDLLASDPSHDVRQHAAQLLGYCRQRRVLEPLIAALKQRDFGVVYEAERSLARLTGHTFEHDPVLWSEWLSRTNEPFADAGKLDDQLDRDDGNWWSRSFGKMRLGKDAESKNRDS